MSQEIVGQIIGKYRVVRLLGEGGMGVVFEGVRDDIGGRAAVKLLHAELARNTDVATRFFNEARAANLIDHPSIVRIFDYGTLPDGRAYLSMEYLEGEALSSRIRRLRRIGQSEVLRLGRQIAAALAAAHEKRVIHRDLKPANVMIVRDPEAPGGERAKLLDFGIAKLSEAGPGGIAQTRTGALMGTPLYMSPEQCRGAGRVDDKTDVYSLGIMLFEMLTGAPPFMGEGHGDLIAKHMFTEAPPLWRDVPDVSPELGSLVAAMLSKDPGARPAMNGVASELQRLGERSLPPGSSPPTPQPPTPISVHPAGSTAATLPPSLNRSQNFELVQRTAAPGSRALRLIAPLAVLVAAGGVAALVISQRGGKRQATELMAAAQAAANAQRWPLALEKLDAALERPELNESERGLARQERDRVERESKTKPIYDRFAAAAGAGSYDAAVAAYRQIPTKSFYYGRAREDYDMLFPLFVDRHLKAAQEARAQGQCVLFKSELAAILEVDGKQVRALALQDESCPAERKAAGSGTTREPKSSPAPSRDSKREAPEAAPERATGELSPEEVDAKLTEAQAEFISGNYAKVISMTRPLTRLKEGSSRAWRIIGAAACHLKDVKLSNEAYRHLDAPGRQYQVYVCQRDGLISSGNQFKLADP
jgi:serine/threonine protein kinase